jgi:hypothetical protein
MLSIRVLLAGHNTAVPRLAGRFLQQTNDITVSGVAPTPRQS